MENLWNLKEFLDHKRVSQRWMQFTYSRWMFTVNEEFRKKIKKLYEEK